MLPLAVAFNSLLVIGIFLISDCFTLSPIRDQELTVSTSLGQLRGLQLETWTNEPFLAFKGIPYAEPPVGKLRFKAPVPVNGWKGVLNATRDAPVCPQIGGERVGPNNEDCLYLNVYSKKLDGRYPVIVYFHPGAFFSMTGASYWYGPDYLLNENIVLVTINYRLDALGFLSTGDEEAEGNNGLKDQVAALRWVNSHISKFGGDPNSVTLAGYSAGSASTFYHMLSPMSKGLFHKVIAMSCGVIQRGLIDEDPLKLTKKLAGLFNCSLSSSKEMVDCLRTIPASNITNQFKAMRRYYDQPMFVFRPVIEHHNSTGERFLLNDPVELIKKKQYSHVPVVTGIVKDEFKEWFAGMLTNSEETKSQLKFFNNNFYKILPVILLYDDKTEKEKRQITDDLRNFYLKGEKINNNTIDGIGDAFADATIIHGEYTTAKLLAKYNNAPVYFYMFNYLGRYGHAHDSTTSKVLGPTHHDELIYLFYVLKGFPKFNTTDPEAFMVRRLTTLWSNFASTGNPTPTNSSVEWLPMGDNNLKYLDLNTDMKMVNGLPYPERMRVWDSLFPID